ncbi:MAG TPA: hypothetical protein DEQ47_01780 [Solibacterales bacterium]|nr:hypothetical protein [Bryobacterales bacterium]
MFIKIQDLETRKLQFDESYAADELDFGESGVRALSRAHATGVAELLPGTEDQFRLKGHVALEAGAECDRCLGAAAFPVEADFDLFYEPASEAAGGEEIAIDEADAETGFYVGDGIELKDVLVEQVLLQLPMQKLCRQDCKGICPVCGSDRNAVTCDCSAKAGDDRWAALRDIAAN